MDYTLRTMSQNKALLLYVTQGDAEVMDTGKLNRQSVVKMQVVILRDSSFLDIPCNNSTWIVPLGTHRLTSHSASKMFFLVIELYKNHVLN